MPTIVTVQIRRTVELICMLDRAAVEQLTKEQLIALVLSLQQRVTALEAKSGSGGPPPFVRAGVKRKQEKQERKKRAQSFA